MNANMKSIRDGAVSGGVAGLVTALLVQYAGMDALVAVPVGAFIAGVTARSIRALRATRLGPVIEIVYPSPS